LSERARVVPGVLRARSYASQTIQRERPDGSKLRFTAVGLDWPEDRGEHLPLVAGRLLHDAHFEIIADRSLGLALGERLQLGREEYSVVGLTSGMSGSSGDGLLFLTLADLARIVGDLPGEAIRLEREARAGRIAASELGRDPQLVRRGRRAGVQIPALGPPQVAAVLVELEAEADLQRVRAALASWPDVSVLDAAEQRDLLLRGVIERARRQIGLFRALLVLISTILMGLIVYTMTLDKMHSLALLKLLGARRRVVLGMILQETLLLGTLAYGVALAVAELTFEAFPRRVLLEPGHRIALYGVVLAISSVASAVGIQKALAADPNQVLAG
jgi:putative ABC transport system permease protein